MTGFTRLLASANGEPDGLMDSMPTVTVAQLGHDKTRGFQVINRPWTMDQFLKRPDEWNARIKEEYVYIAETDHLIIREIPNRATPKLGVAFFFPYMSPVIAEQVRASSNGTSTATTSRCSRSGRRPRSCTSRASRS